MTSSVSQRSELGVEHLGEDLTGALADIAEVSAVLEVPAVGDAGDEGGVAGDYDAGESGAELAVLLEVAEGGQLAEDLIKMGEVAVTIGND